LGHINKLVFEFCTLQLTGFLPYRKCRKRWHHSNSCTRVTTKTRFYTSHDNTPI